MSNEPSPLPPERRALRLLLILGSLLLALPLAELGARILLWGRGTPYDGAALEEGLVRGLNTMQAFTPKPGRSGRVPAKRALHPYFAAETGADPGGVMSYFQGDEAGDGFEVLVVGGSVAMLFGRDASAALESQLAADPRLAGRTVRVLRGAHAAYKQPQHLNKVAYLLAQGYWPDVVFNLDGFNEIAGGMENGKNGRHPMFPSPPVWSALLMGRDQSVGEVLLLRAKLELLRQEYAGVLSRAQDRGWLRSAVLGTWIEDRLDGVQKRKAAVLAEVSKAFEPGKNKERSNKDRSNKDRELNGDRYDPSEEAIVDLSLQSWVQCSISLAAMCRARGIGYVHGIQPTLWDKGAKPLSAEEQQVQGLATWRRGVELGYPRLRAAVPELEGAGIATLDLTMAFQDVEQTLYYDPCHYVAEGSLLLVDQVAQAILAQLPD